MRRILVLVLLLAAAVASAQVFTPSQSFKFPAPGSSGLCWVSSSSTAYGWGSCSGTSSTAWANLTSGTNTTLAGVCGSGCSIDVAGTGFINATKINGVALSGLTTGILKNTTTTGAPSIAIASDFPTLNQNTTGTAANLSGTPALPNGTTGTTQSVADNTTKLATDAFVIANAGGTPAFSVVTGGTNTAAAMVVGTGASLAASGSGTIAATSVPAAGLGAGTLSNNTSGTAANLSGTPALPNGTTATTQTGGDNTTKVATTAFVQSAVSGSGSISGLTATKVPKATSSTAIADSSISDDGTNVTVTEPLIVGGSNGQGKLTQGTAPTTAAGFDWLYADSTALRLKMMNNGGSADTILGAATTDTLTNKTFDTAGSGNSFSINGVAATANTGTGSVVRATSPTLVTAALGSSTATTQSAKDNSTKVATTAYVDAPTPLTTGTSVTLSAPRQYFVCTTTCTITVPVPAAGYEFCVMNDDNVSTVITLSAIGSSARYENTARTAYGTAGTGTFVSGGAAGDKVCLLGRDSTHYLTAAFNGTWTAN